jgi:hypothetical protein
VVAAGAAEGLGEQVIGNPTRGRHRLRPAVPADPDEVERRFARTTRPCAGAEVPPIDVYGSATH